LPVISNIFVLFYKAYIWESVRFETGTVQC